MSQRNRTIARLIEAGITFQDALQLHRIAATLHTWHERECGTDNGCIERDEETGKPYWLNSIPMRRFPIPDREKGALKRLEAIGKRYPEHVFFVQSDPRGASLYVLRPEDKIAGQPTENHYTRGIAI